MTESNTVLAPAQGDQPQIVKIGTLAAQNLALALNLAETHVPTIEKAISDEINAMSAHFSLAFADVQAQYEAEVLKLKSSFKFVQENPAKVAVFGAAAFVLGVVAALLV